MKNYDRSPEMGKRLRQKRKSISLTIREVASKAEISASHLSRIEQGDRLPSASVLRRLAEPLGYEETELMMQAGYLSPVKSATENGTRGKKLDPYVASVLVMNHWRYNVPLFLFLQLSNVLLQRKHALKTPENKK